MAIMVQCKDKTFSFVPNQALDYLIATKSIIAFRRSSGWTEISRDPLRKKRASKKFEGQDRRGPAVKMSCLTCSDFVNSLCRTGKCPTRIYMMGKYT